MTTDAPSEAERSPEFNAGYEAGPRDTRERCVARHVEALTDEIACVTNGIIAKQKPMSTADAEILLALGAIGKAFVTRIGGQ